MSFSARGLPDSAQRRRLEMPQFFSTRRVKARSFSTFCWMWICAVSSRASSSGDCSAGVVSGGLGAQGESMPKLTSRWPFCSYPATLKRGPKPRMRTVWARSRQAEPGGPGKRGRRDRGRRRPRRGWRRSQGGCMQAPALGGPELPAHLELVCHVVVELLGGLGDGGIDEFVEGVGGGIDWDGGVEVRGDGIGVDALVGGRLGEVDGIGGGGGDTLGSDLGELAQNAGKRVGQGLQAEVGIPEAEIEAVCHGGSF